MIPPEQWPARAEHHEHWVRRGVWLVLALGLVAFLLRGADRPADPHVEAVAPRQPLEGFEEIVFRVTRSDGGSADWCALLAATQAARQQGLMGQADLRGYDAMVFRFEQPVDGGFYMFRTTLPLSIAWFDAAGAFVSAADMPPCVGDDPGACPTYPAAGPYLHAVEVTQGGLAALGIAAGATLAFPGGRCA